jgi:hypothetical protein
MKTYDLLKNHGFLVENYNGDSKTLSFNQDKVFLLDFLNENGFSKQNNGLYGNDRRGLINEFYYEYGSDEYSGMVRIIFKFIHNKLYILFECPKPAKKDFA